MRISFILFFIMLETIGISQIMNENSLIYKTGSTFTFNAVLRQKNGSEVSCEKISLKIIGGIKNGTNKQLNARWIYESYPNIDTSLTIGVFESDSFIFLHQPRYGKYLFSEVCGFPSVSRPLQVGLVSKSKTKIPKDSPIYGRFQGWRVKSKSIIKDKKIICFNGEYINVWQIVKVSKHKGGKSKAVFYYHEQFGFIEMKFISWENEMLEMNLLSINKTDE